MRLCYTQKLENVAAQKCVRKETSCSPFRAIRNAGKGIARIFICHLIAS
jgi:hypothetical protein